MKTLLNLILKPLGWTGLCLLCTCGSFFIGYYYPHPQTVTDQLKALQRQVGCKKVDAVIGQETTELVNAAVKYERWELFNSYAAVYMTPTGEPR